MHVQEFSLNQASLLSDGFFSVDPCENSPPPILPIYPTHRSESSSVLSTLQRILNRLGRMDLARVRTIDSIGLSMIIVLCKLTCKSDGEMLIENASSELKKHFPIDEYRRASYNQPDRMAQLKGTFVSIFH